jgi:hypothetical protein
MSRYALAKLVGFAIAPAAVIYRPAGRPRAPTRHTQPHILRTPTTRSLTRALALARPRRRRRPPPPYQYVRARAAGRRPPLLASASYRRRETGLSPNPMAISGAHALPSGPSRACCCWPPSRQVAMSPSCMRCGGICECNCCNSALAASRDREP